MQGNEASSGWGLLLYTWSSRHELNSPMFAITELRLVIVLIGVLTLPGWAMLTFSDGWRQWRGLQRWIVAIGISIAFYPVFFYGIRSVFPLLTVGPYKVGVLLFICAVVAVWRMHGHWGEHFAFDWLEWTAIGVFGMTLFTRFWIIRDHPYPAWSDSLHHTLLTQLTAVQGKLPVNMEPYSPTSLGQYHLGLYSLSATVQWLAQVPAHTALLWIAQALNGLCGVGVYLVLDRKIGRVGAVVGAAVVGLWSHQPSWYVNWGRFTQLSGQTILLIAWMVTWEAIALWKRPWQEYKVKILWNAACAAMLTGAVFLLHFRVAVFYLPLLMISVTWELLKAQKENRIRQVVLGTVVIGAVALIVIIPVLWEAMRIHVAMMVDNTKSALVTTDTSEVSRTIQLYYRFPLHTLPILVARPWLIALASLGVVIGLLTRSKLTTACLVWIVVLYLLGNAYVLGLSLTNMGSVLTMMYLPIGLIVGSAVESTLFMLHRREQIVRLVVVLVLIVGFVTSHIRVMEIEPYRHFVTSEDIAAMNWIRENTPADALFAVNTCFWLPNAPHGTDAGYWIPYFTGRQTTVGAMLDFVEATEYGASLVRMSRTVEQLEVDNASLTELQLMGVDYIYIGRTGDFSGPGLNVTQLSQAENIIPLYQNAGVSILQIKPPD